MPVPPEPYVNAKLHIVTGDGRHETIVLWYLGIGLAGDPPTEHSLFVNDRSLVISAPLRDALSNECEYLGMESHLHQSGVTWSDSSKSGAGPGNEVSDPLPEFAAAVIQKKSGFPGRSGAGRWFIGGVPESLTTEGRLNATGIGAYEFLAAKLVEASGIGGLDLFAATFSNLDSDLYQIIATHVDPVIGRQSRRRLRSPV